MRLGDFVEDVVFNCVTLRRGAISEAGNWPPRGERNHFGNKIFRVAEKKHQFSTKLALSG
jgi:hypothetical protein